MFEVFGARELNVLLSIILPWESNPRPCPDRAVFVYGRKKCAKSSKNNVASSLTKYQLNPSKGRQNYHKDSGASDFGEIPCTLWHMKIAPDPLERKAVYQLDTGYLQVFHDELAGRALFFLWILGLKSPEC